MVSAVGLPEGVVEGHSVDDVCVLVERKELLARVGVPNLACSVIGASDEFATILVECAVCQWEQVSTKHFLKTESLLLILLLFFNQFFYQFLQLGLARL